MSQNSFMDKLRTFLGIRQEPPRNDFRNPIWGTDDDDDGDELYTRQQQMNQFDPSDIHRDIARQMNDMLKSFGSIFGDMRSFFQDDHFDELAGFGDIPEESESQNNNSIRDYYLKPGYHNGIHDKQDMDLDGKISSNEISGLLKQKDKVDKNCGPLVPFNGEMVPGRSFCKTIITTSITKPDGTVETRRIVKNGNEIVEETITSTEHPPSPYNTGLESIRSSGVIYNNIMAELSSLFRNFY